MTAEEIQQRVDAIEKEWPKKKATGKPFKMGEFPLDVQKELLRRACARLAPSLNNLGRYIQEEASDQ
jgi:hypothetical protein